MTTPSSAPVVQSIIERGEFADCRISPDIPSIFRPPLLGGQLTPQALSQALRMEPFNLLPRFLVGPDVAIITVFDMIPPTFYYGWRPDLKKMLALAEARNLTVKLPPMDDEDDLGMAQTAEHSAATSITFGLVVKSLMAELEKKGTLGRWCRRVEGRTTLLQDDGNKYIIAALTNYDLTQCEDELPTPEEMMKLQRELQITLGVNDASPPKWYADELRFQWHDPELNNVITLPGSAKWHVDYDAHGQTVTEEYF